MKTSEFIKRVKELGYSVRIGRSNIVVHNNEEVIMYASKDVADAYWAIVSSTELFDILVAYAKTPIEERKDVKKYYLYHEALNGYFNYHKIDKYYFWGGVHQAINVQTMFTEEQIENNKFRDIMLLLEKVEVK